MCGPGLDNISDWSQNCQIKIHVFVEHKLTLFIHSVPTAPLKKSKRTRDGKMTLRPN